MVSGESERRRRRGGAQRAGVRGVPRPAGPEDAGARTPPPGGRGGGDRRAVARVGFDGLLRGEPAFTEIVRELQLQRYGHHVYPLDPA